MLLSSAIKRLVVRMRTNVGEEYITCIFKAENQPNKKPACSTRGYFTLKIEAMSSSETSAQIRTTRRYISEDGNIQPAFRTLYSWL
jgi:hypothetical protein